jgi:hypothetical protein
MTAAVPDRPTLPSENDFWDTPPRYSIASELPIEPPALPQPSLRRLILARFLFVAILAAIVAPFVHWAMSH